MGWVGWLVCYLVYIGSIELVVMDCKLNAVVDLGCVLSELRDELQLRREGNGGAMQRLLIQNYESLDIVYFLWH